jgi:3',5'-cyclic AMP phosphodiesterase CpdA
LLVAAACTGTVVGVEDRPDAGPPPDGFVQLPMPTSETGGSLFLPHCGHEARTRRGATAPWIPPDDAPLGAAPAPRHVHLGLVGDPRHAIAVVWRAGDDTTLATQVRYGVESLDEHRQRGFTFVYRSGAAAGSPRIRIHEAHLCGLRPDTVYRYQVGGDGAWSPEYTFRTAPDLAADPSAPVSIAVLGDSRGGQTMWGELLAAADAAAMPDAIFFTGDAVTSGVGQGEWDAFFERGAGVLPYVPLVMAMGNHESNAINFFAQLAQPGGEDSFSLDYGAAHLVVLNDSASEASVAGDQRAFLDDDLAAATAPWKLLMHHRAMYSSSTGHGSNLTLRDTWGPVVDAHRVDLVLAGHDHVYERTRPVRAGAVAEGGTVYLVTGGAGAPLYATGRQPFSAFTARRNHWVALTVRAGRLEGRAHADDGTLLDSFALAR